MSHGPECCCNMCDVNSDFTPSYAQGHVVYETNDGLYRVVYQNAHFVPMYREDVENFHVFETLTGYRRYAYLSLAREFVERESRKTLDDQLMGEAEEREIFG